MVDVVTEMIIAAPIEQVAAYAADPDMTPEWYVNIKSIEWKSAKPIQIGTLLAFKAKFLGRELAYTYEVVEWIPNEKMIMRTADGPFPMETTYTWEKIDDQHTRMRLRNRGTPSGFSKLLAPLMVPAMKRANLKDLQLIKKILEQEVV